MRMWEITDLAEASPGRTELMELRGIKHLTKAYATHVGTHVLDDPRGLLDFADNAGPEDNPNGISEINEIWQILRKQGFEWIDNGFKSVVVMDPNQRYVLKVWKNDYGYDQFIAFCKSHKGDPHLPRFVSRSVNLGKTYKMVRIEILQAFDWEQYDYGSRNFEDLAQEFSSCHTVVDVQRQLKERAPILTGAFAKLDSVIRRWPGLMVTLVEIYKAHPDRMDLEYHNIMARNDGTPVVIDPWG